MTEGKPTHHRAHRGETDDWLTPPWILEALGPFALDPCAPINPPWPTARRMISPPTDGLSEPWRGLVWLNPPYGPQAGLWIAKLAHHGNGIALVYARTETRWWFESVWTRATSILFLRGRVRFHRPDGTPGPGNSGNAHALVSYGLEASQRLKKAHDEGLIQGSLVHHWMVLR